MANDRHATTLNHTMPRLPDRQALPPWSRRAVAGFGIGAIALAGPWLIIVLMLAFGGRFAHGRGGEWDLLVLALTYPLGPALAGLLLGILMPLLRRPWVAVVLGMVAGVAWFATMSLAMDPHGSAPYSVKWPISIFSGVIFGPIAGALAHDLIPIERRRRQRSANRTR